MKSQKVQLLGIRPAAFGKTERVMYSSPHSDTCPVKQRVTVGQPHTVQGTFFFTDGFLYPLSIFFSIDCSLLSDYFYFYLYCLFLQLHHFVRYSAFVSERGNLLFFV